MPIFFKQGGAIQIDIEDRITELSKVTGTEALSLAKSNAPVVTGAYRNNITTTTPDLKGWTIMGGVGHSIEVEWKWGHMTLNNSVRKALTDNGVVLH